VPFTLDGFWKEGIILADLGVNVGEISATFAVGTGVCFMTHAQTEFSQINRKNFLDVGHYITEGGMFLASRSWEGYGFGLGQRSPRRCLRWSHHCGQVLQDWNPRTLLLGRRLLLQRLTRDRHIQRRHT
jgi:hypothetical protein